MSGDSDLLTTAEATARIGWRTHHKFLSVAKSLGIGIDLGGRAGMRFTPEEVERVRESLRPKATPRKKRGRRRAS